VLHGISGILREEKPEKIPPQEKQAEAICNLYNASRFSRSQARQANPNKPLQCLHLSQCHEIWYALCALFFAGNCRPRRFDSKGEKMIEETLCRPMVYSFVLAGLTACASVPPPTEQMAVAHSAVSHAHAATASQHAPLELRTAQAKLEQAEAAMRREEYATARRLAEQAEVDANLAWTKAQTVKAKQAVSELEEGIRVLNQELERRKP
jgi:hypothetical protein